VVSSVADVEPAVAVAVVTLPRAATATAGVALRKAPLSSFFPEPSL
jgi:hypothetical protein